MSLSIERNNDLDDDDFRGLMSGFDEFEAPAFKEESKNEPILDDDFTGGILKHNDDFIPIDLLTSIDNNGESKTRTKNNEKGNNDNK